MSLRHVRNLSLAVMTLVWLFVPKPATAREGCTSHFGGDGASASAANDQCLQQGVENCDAFCRQDCGATSYSTQVTGCSNPQYSPNPQWWYSHGDCVCYTPEI